jgi:hypothetical protein
MPWRAKEHDLGQERRLADLPMFQTWRVNRGNVVYMKVPGVGVDPHLSHFPRYARIYAVNTGVPQPDDLDGSILPPDYSCYPVSMEWRDE